MTVAGTLVGDYFEGEERHKYTGLQAAFMNIGGIVFITLGGFLAEISWQTPFLIYLAAFLMIPLVIKYLYEPKIHHEYTYGTFSLKEVIHIFFYTFVGIIIFYMIPTQIPFLLHSTFGVNGAETGLAIAATMVTSSIMATQYKRIKQKITYHKAYAIVALGFGFGFLLIASAHSLATIFIGLAVTGIGAGVMIVNSMNHLLHAAPAKARGKAVGFNTSVMSAAMFLSPVMVAPLVTLFGLQMSFGVLGAVLLVIALGFLITKRDD